MLFITICLISKLLIPMDNVQTDHLRAYGIAYQSLDWGLPVEWLLNWRGGAFLLEENQGLKQLCDQRGVMIYPISLEEEAQIKAEIAEINADVVVLEKAPKVAVYQTPTAQPWDDAVVMALDYAFIPYDKIWDEEVLNGELDQYDWIHLHHEDFTGQLGKFWASYRNTEWYKQQFNLNQELAFTYGYDYIWQLKQAVAEKIRQYVNEGGYLFAMCSACDTWEISMAAYGLDIVDTPFDGSPPQTTDIDTARSLAFTNYQIITDPMVYEHSDIDVSQEAYQRGEQMFFSLYEFSAKQDPVPTMLTQNHQGRIREFMGQCTGFHSRFIRPYITIMGVVDGTDEVKYLSGNFGEGSFTYYGGHDPEDYTHYVGDPPTDLNFYPNSPGYRLILNNVLFPAAKKKELKT
ncbi:MAG: asparagine synthetase B [Desulfuromonas sp. SDB]|nr:MAG: asparagine synthetase B [Desulfuromonas sp. SDB]